MAKGKAIAKAGEGLVGKAAAKVLKRAAKPGVKAAERGATRAGERVAANTGADAANAGRRAAARNNPPIRNDSGLPRTPATAEARRAYDKAHGTEPPWGKVTEGYHGPKPDDMVRPHGHHIVYKHGRGATQRRILAESKEILERNGIDWYTGGDNLIWAPNRAHTTANAQAVLDALKAADGQGRQAVIDALRNAGRNIFGGKP